MSEQRKNQPQNKTYYIYLITNTINDKKYIGWSTNTTKRWVKHLWESEHKSDCYLHRAIKKYGKENFTFEDGRCITVKGLNTWARENNQSAGNLHNVLTGKRPFSKDVVKVERIF